MKMLAAPEPKTCPVCLKTFAMGPIKNPDRIGQERYSFRKKTFCSPKCQGAAHRMDPKRQAKSRSGASNTAKRLYPKRPCERCGETRQSQVHHKDRNYMNNALDNLE